MGIDLEANGRKKLRQRKFPRSENPYLRTAVKLYKFLTRRTGSEFNQIVLKRLVMSRQHHRPMTLRRIAKLLARRKVYDKDASSKIVVIVGTVTNDSRELEIPKVRVCALKVTEAARSRILAAGGEILTFDQLALISPEGKGTVLLRGSYKTEKRKMFGTPVQGSKPKVRARGRKFERARGRRASRGFKVKYN